MVRNGVSTPPEPGLGGARADLIILSVSAFASVTTEMAPVGLLPSIGHAFGVAESTAGLLVSLYAVLGAGRGGGRGRDPRAFLLRLYRLCHPAGAARADGTGAGACLGGRAGRLRSRR